MSDDELRAHKPDPPLPWELSEDMDSRGVPRDARQMGFDRNTEEGALIAFSGSLDGRKPMHRLVAWVLLVSFGLPMLIAALVYAERLLEWLFTS
jgi:hypothetical protein